MTAIDNQQCIIAPATAPGVGAVAMLRLSGKNAVEIFSRFFSKKKIIDAKGYTAHFGTISDANRQEIDQVVATVFRAPHSFTGQDTVEITAHGSPYIVQRLMELFVSQPDVRAARAGEFTLRGFLNGKMDLSQAEAVADLIASDSHASHQVALNQMKGGFSKEIADMRTELINFASLVELELDFAEEDVDFADRTALVALVERICPRLKQLAASFAQGNVFKNGVPIAIIGKPNAGKSTLLNTLVGEQRAIVSPIAGTTRDTIEEVYQVEGISFRFIDTAGIREAQDEIEAIGVQRSIEKAHKAQLILYVFDLQNSHAAQIIEDLKVLGQREQPIVLVANKIDILPTQDAADAIEKIRKSVNMPIRGISAKQSQGIEDLKKTLVSVLTGTNQPQFSDTVVSNIRHFEAINHTLEALSAVLDGISAQLSTELLAFHIREALHYLGEISGQITSDDLLTNIFSKFCIGK